MREGLKNEVLLGVDLDYGNQNPGYWPLHYKAVINAKGMQATRPGTNKFGPEEKPPVCGVS